MDCCGDPCNLYDHICNRGFRSRGHIPGQEEAARAGKRSARNLPYLRFK